MATSIENIYRSVIDVNINGKEKTFVINYNEQNIVTKVAVIENNVAIELHWFSKFSIFKNIHIDDIDEKMIIYINDFNIAFHNVYSAIIDAEINRKDTKRS